MKKITSLLIVITFLSGCVESMALLGPATTGAGSGKIAQSAVSSVVSYGVKKQTGKSPSEHALAYVKTYNPEDKEEKCIKFIEATKTKTCAAIKENISSSKDKFIEVKSIIFDKSKIEDLAKNAGLTRR